MAMEEPGIDKHEWESEWQALEPLVVDAPVEALPEVNELIERMMVAQGYAVEEETARESAEPEVVAEFLEARPIAVRQSTRATSAPQSPLTAASTST